MHTTTQGPAKDAEAKYRTELARNEAEASAAASAATLRQREAEAEASAVASAVARRESLEVEREKVYERYEKSREKLAQELPKDNPGPRLGQLPRVHHASVQGIDEKRGVGEVIVGAGTKGNRGEGPVVHRGRGRVEMLLYAAVIWRSPVFMCCRRGCENGFAITCEGRLRCMKNLLVRHYSTRNVCLS